jgi:DNA-binding NtrC family response regulator
MERPKVRVLIVEPNPRMRDFLRREFSKLNFLVEGVASGEDLFSRLDSGEKVHVVVFAMDIPGNTDGVLQQQLVTNYPDIPVILNAYLEDLPDSPFLRKVAAMVEKSGNPENLIRMVSRVLERYYPDLVENRAQRSSNV